MQLILTNIEEYVKEVNHLLFENFRIEILQQLYDSIYSEGTKERFIIYHKGRYLMFEFLHEMGHQVYYTFVVQVKARRWEYIDKS